MIRPRGLRKRLACLVAPIGLALSCVGGDEPEACAPARFALRGRWEDPSALTYRLDHEGSPLAESVVTRVLEAACEAWSQTGPVGFRLAAEDEAPDFVVSWGRAEHGPCPPFGMDTSVAHSGPVGPGTFLHLDLDRNWTAEGSADGGVVKSLEQTLLHELGHILGLDHSPDPQALLHADPSTMRIECSDRAGLATLYGGKRHGPGDLVVTREGRTLATLHGVASPGRTDFAFFDTNGNGQDELLLWRTDPSGAGEIVTFLFDSLGRPLRTIGPRLGMVAPEATTALASLPTGERLLLLTYPNGYRVARAFDSDGVLHTFAGVLPDVLSTERRLEGDLDGDGLVERVTL